MNGHIINEDSLSIHNPFGLSAIIYMIAIGLNFEIIKPLDFMDSFDRLLKMKNSLINQNIETE